MTFIADLRTNMRACVGLHVCILPIHTIHAVTVLTTFITKPGSKITALRIVARSQISLFAEQRKKVTFIADLRTNMRACVHVCILPIHRSYDSRSHRSDHIKEITNYCYSEIKLHNIFHIAYKAIEFSTN